MFSEFSYTHGRKCVYGRSAPELLKTYVVRNVKLNVIAVSIFLQFFHHILVTSLHVISK